MLRAVLALISLVEICAGYGSLRVRPRPNQQQTSQNYPYGCVKTAKANLHLNEPPFKSVGAIHFSQPGPGKPVRIRGYISEGLHGFHIHGAPVDSTKMCETSGGHFNPFNKTHGGPSDQERHVGDLGNIQVTEGVTLVDFHDVIIQLSGDAGIIGKALVIHAGKDDLGQGGNADGLKTGNAGSRVMCGNVELIQDCFFG